MRFVDTILNHFKRKRRNDPVFGSMLYMGDHLKYWEGNATFPPTGSIIEVFDDGLSEDDLKQQHRFFQELTQNWPSVREKIEKILLINWRRQESKTPVGFFWEQFKLSSLTIPRAPLEAAEWEISFVNPSDPGHIWTVQMKGPQPKGVNIDG